MIIFVLSVNQVYAFSPLNNVSGTIKDICKVRVIQTNCSLDILEIIKKQSEKHNMDWKVVYSIVGYESGFNSKKIYTTEKEKSYGLLQVNIKTNFPKDSNSDLLLNPEYNLNYQLNNLKEVYMQGTKISLNGIDLAEYVSKYGQRADWNNKENVKYIKKSIKTYYSEAILIES